MSEIKERLEDAEKALASTIRRHIALSPHKVHTIGTIAKALEIDVEQCARALNRVEAIVSGFPNPVANKRVELI